MSTSNENSQFDEAQVRHLYKVLGHSGIGHTLVFCRDLSKPNGDPKAIVDRALAESEDDLVDWARTYNGKGNLFVGRNPRDEDEGVVAVTGISLDIDFIRPKDTAVTEEQLNIALEAGQRIIYHFKTGILASSGNGALVLFPIDSFKLLDGDKKVFEEQCKLFEGECRQVISDIKDIRIDSTFDLPRLIKIPGSLSTKGDRSLWRMARFIGDPSNLKSPDLLAKIRSYQVASTKTHQNNTTEVQIVDRSLEDFKRVVGYKKRGLSKDEALVLISSESLRPDRTDDHSRIVDKVYAENGSSQAPHLASSESPPVDPETYFQRNRFLVTKMSADILSKHKIISSPIDSSGKGKFLYGYKNGVFTPNGSSISSDECVRLLGDYFKDDCVKKTEDYLMRTTKVSWDQLNHKANDLINVKNGMLDWKSGKLLQFDPKYLSTIQINANYDRNAKSQELDDFLDQIMDKECTVLLEEGLGLLLLPDTSYEKAFLFKGSGDNGKSTLSSLINNWLGNKNVSHISLHKIINDKYAAADLLGVLVNICTDISSLTLKDTGFFKMLVSGEWINAEKKFKDQFEFRPFARFIFSANELPKSWDKSYAFFKRWIIIPFTRQFKGKKADRNLVKRLTTSEVRSALLNKALSGLRRLKSNGEFTLPSTVGGEIQEYRKRCDSAYEFIQERLTFSIGTNLGKQAVYDAYLHWCERNRQKEINQGDFNKTLLETLNIKERQIKSSEGKKIRGWKNLKWVDQDD